MPPRSIRTRRFESKEVAFAQIDQERTPLWTRLNERIQQLQKMKKPRHEDKQYISLKAKIRVLHAERNEYPTVSDFTDEIITRILYFARHIPESGQKDSGAWRLALWFGASRVSQRWRAIALAYPHYWTGIGDQYPNPILTEWLTRAQNGPISLHLHGSPPKKKFIGIPMNRIRVLVLDTDRRSWETFLGKHLTAEAPLLESLSITIEKGDVKDNHPPTALTKRAFKRIPPPLQHLKLKGCCVDITSPFMANLTTLEILDPPEKVDAEELLATLRQIPRLSLLILSNVLDPDEAPVTMEFEDDVVALALLKRLSITGQSFGQDLALLSHLSIPATTPVKFNSVISTPAVQALSDFLTTYDKVHPAPRRILVDKVDMTWTEKVKVEVNPGCLESGYVADLLAVELQAKGGRDSLEDTPDVASLFSHRIMRKITSLTMNESSWVTPEAWANIFTKLPDLQRISTWGTPGIFLLDVLIDDFKANYIGPRLPPKPKPHTQIIGRDTRQTPPRFGQTALRRGWNPIFPSLEHIEIRETELFDRANDVLCMLRARRIAGKGLEYFRIKYTTGVEDELIEDLQEVVTTVKWDKWRCEDDGIAEEDLRYEDMDLHTWYAFFNAP